MNELVLSGAVKKREIKGNGRRDEGGFQENEWGMKELKWR